jgi:hypothetical protein
VDLATGAVSSLVGLGLFTFGDEDGVGDEVLLQHPEGLAYHEGVLYVADTYNNKLKCLDPATRAVTTLAGAEDPGYQDGPPALARLDEPSGLSAAGVQLYVADLNNHAVRMMDLARGDVRTLELRGLD